MPDKRYDVEELDELLNDGVDPANLAGRWVTYYDDEPHQLTLLSSGVLAIRVRLSCMVCKVKKMTVYVGSGAPGWCYAYNRRGEYLCDLRSMGLVCAACSEGV